MYQLILQTNTRRFCPGESEYGVDNIYEDFNNANIISPKKLPGYDNAPTPRKEADHLIELFAGWALANCTKFRRFVALTTVTPEPRWKTWNHLEVSDVETFLKIHQIDCARLWHELGLTGELNVKLSAASVSSAAARDQRSQNTSTSTFTPRTPNLGTPRELDAVRRAPSVKGGGGGGCRGSGSSYPQPYR